MTAQPLFKKSERKLQHAEAISVTLPRWGNKLEAIDTAIATTLYPHSRMPRSPRPKFIVNVSGVATGCVDRGLFSARRARIPLSTHKSGALRGHLPCIRRGLE